VRCLGPSSNQSPTIPTAPHRQALALAWREGSAPPSRSALLGRPRQGAEPGERSPATAPPPSAHAHCPSPVAQAGVDVSHGNRERRGRRCAALVAWRLQLFSASASRRGRPTQFTEKNAFSGMPSRLVFPRVTRGMFCPRHPPEDFEALVSLPVHGRVVPSVFMPPETDFFVLCYKAFNAIIAL
jgi:hypothetical protein